MRSAELSHGPHGIAAALLVVRDVQQHLDVARIGGVEHTIDFFRTLADAVHVVVIRDWNADVGSALADLGHQLAQPLVVCGHQRAFWTRVRELQELPADVAHEPRVLQVRGHVFRLELRFDPHVPARERHHRQAMLRQQLLERRGLVAELRQRRRPQLNPLEADRGHILDRLAILSLPGDGGIPELNVIHLRSFGTSVDRPGK